MSGKNVVMIFAGGTGQRMHSGAVPKQFMELYGKPVIVYTLEKFQAHGEIDGIVVACLESWIPELEGLVERYGLSKVRAIVPGGSTGQESIYNGLVKLEELYPEEDTAVLIHDGVRPLIDADTISRNIRSIREHGNGITASPAIETVMVRNADDIDEVVDRSKCFSAKAPQGFYLKDILACHRKAISEGRNDFIDSAAMFSHYGNKLYPVEGSTDNIKITTPVDFHVFKAILDSYKDQESNPNE